MKKGIVLKISGEALAGANGIGIDHAKVLEIAKEIKELYEVGGIELSVVVGAGNIFRGRDAIKVGMNRSNADYMGMLATILNALSIQSALESLGLDTRVMTSLSIPQVAEPYIRRKALSHLEKDRVIIFGGGNGIPFFSTDTTAALRAAELGASLILMAKNGVDGVYSDDPRTNPNAKKYSKITYDDIIIKGLKVMDTASCALCKQNSIPIVVFDFAAKGSIIKILKGEDLGTYVGG